MSNETKTAAQRLGFDEDATAQDVIDALRIVLLAQKDPARALPVVEMLIEQAPETDSSRGIDLLLHLITEASLKVEVADHGA